MPLQRLAPAKVNLFLHVGALRADGYHPISSLMTFASVGDVVRVEDAPAMAFELQGPFSGPLGADAADNLVVRARDAVMAAFEAPRRPFLITLDKRLPIAAGLGGGSSDAAAAMRLLADALGLGSGDERLGTIARSLGADVTACLAAEAVLATGRGDDCAPPPPFPDIEAVLVNPGVPSPTGRVYAAYDAAGAPGGADTPRWPAMLETPQALAAFLADCRNDLEAPAVSLQPIIGEVLDILRGQPEALLARMSGSGATCFALCADEAARDELARRLAGDHPAWWVKACRLGGSSDARAAGRSPR
jgi:4-diphosphocytidyl-2-C-methyl-D-erythritol kinase